MTATKTSLTVEQGSDWGHGWLVTYKGDPIDDTWAGRAQVRGSAASVHVLAELGVTVNPDGSVVIGVGPSESSAWTWRQGVYDLEVTNADESVTLRVAQGSVTVDPEVTRD